MKNFRKVLALILVVATLFSFVAMASAKTADEYKDYEDVKYVEAVDVLTAIGINEGYDGAFHPADPIDRDEVAAMIARLRNGGEIDADLYVGADNVYADVKGQWSEGYVTYCSQLGIIAGRNASTFDPDAKVTGTEVMKMLLCVLGYDAAEQGYTGANWQVNVVRDATKSGLLIEGVDPYKAATRDEVAQYFLNALNARMVIGYLGEGLVKITNSIWADISRETVGNWFEITTPDSTNGGVEITYCNAVISGDYLWESIPGLNAAEYEEDCLGRPGHKWTMTAANGKVTTIGFYADAPAWTSAAPTTANVAAALKDVNKDFTAEGNLWVYLNGEKVENRTVKTGNGIESELYYFTKADGTKELRLVQVETFIGKVTDVNTYYKTFTVNGHTFDLGTAELAENDYVLYQFCDGSNPVHAAPNACDAKGCTKKLHSVTVVEPITVEITAGDLYMDSNYPCIYDAGKAYYYSVNRGLEIKAEPMDVMVASDIATNGTEWNLYLDQNGYIMYYAVPTAETEYGYAYLVEDTAFETYLGELVGTKKYSYTGDMVKFGADGALTATEDMAINKGLYDQAVVRTNNDSLLYGPKDATIGTLVRYYYNAKGEFQFNYADGDEAEYAAVGTKLSNKNFVLGTDGEGHDIIANGETKFMVRTKVGSEYVYTQYTGYKSLPGTYYAETVKFAYNNGKTRTNIQFFYDNDAIIGNNYSGVKIANYVFIDAKYATAEADHFFILGNVPYGRFESVLIENELYETVYGVYDAFVDGKRAVVASSMPLIEGAFYQNPIKFLCEATIAGQTYDLYVYAGAQPFPNALIDFTYTVAGNEVYVHAYLNGELETYELAADAAIVILDGEYNAKTAKWDLKVTTTSAEFAQLLKGGMKMGRIVLNDDDQISALYMVEADYDKVNNWN